MRSNIHRDSPDSQRHPAELDHLANVASALAPYPLGSQSTHVSSMPSEVFNETMRNVVSGLNSGGTNPTHASNEDGDPHDAHGTLMVSREGRSKYLGPTAGSEWLKDVRQPTSHMQGKVTNPSKSEIQDVSESPSVADAPTPEAIPAPQTIGPPANKSRVAFPFSVSTARIRTRDLLAHLPPREEAWILVECYYRYCAWQ